jgi:protein SCO1
MLVMAGCGGHVPIKQYRLKGKVVRLVPEHRLAAIQHEEIKGWMEAMTMEFPVRDGSEFAKLKLGLEIEATVNVQDIDYWLSEIRVRAAADPP